MSVIYLINIKKDISTIKNVCLPDFFANYNICQKLLIDNEVNEKTDNENLEIK